MKKRSVLYKSLIAANEKVQYDEYVKKILSNKAMLARILREIVEEYRSFSIEEIKACIEPQIQISNVSIDTGSESCNIQGDRTEEFLS